MTRILHLIDDATIGGGQLHVLRLAEGLRDAGLETSVACAPSGFLVDELARAGIPHERVVLSERPSLGGIWDVRKVLRRVRPSILHTHGGTAGFYGRIAARMVPRTGTVHTYHGIHYLSSGERWKRVVQKGIDRFLGLSTDAIICVAASDLDLAMKNGLAQRDRAYVIRNGIDVSLFGPTDEGVRRWSGNDLRRPIIGTVGRLHRQKGHAYLLESLPKIRKAFPHVEVRLIGDGPLREDLERAARMIGVADCVRFLGSRGDVAQQLREMDLFVLPSLWEGLPYVLLEAMASGVPVVATAVNGVKEIIGTGNEMLLVPPADPEALGLGILSLLENESERRRMREAALARVRAEFDLSATIRATIEVYRKVLDR